MGSLVGELLMSISWGIFSWAGKIPRENFSRLLSGGWKIGCQLSGCLKEMVGESDLHSVRTHLLYCFHSGSFLVFSCACGPQSRHPSVLLDPENNTLPVFCWDKDEHWRLSALLSRLTTTFSLTLFPLYLSTLLPCTSSCIYNSWGWGSHLRFLQTRIQFSYILYLSLPLEHLLLSFQNLDALFSFPIYHCNFVI